MMLTILAQAASQPGNLPEVPASWGAIIGQFIALLTAAVALIAAIKGLNKAGAADTKADAAGAMAQNATLAANTAAVSAGRAEGAGAGLQASVSRVTDRMNTQDMKIHETAVAVNNNPASGNVPVVPPAPEKR